MAIFRGAMSSQAIAHEQARLRNVRLARERRTGGGLSGLTQQLQTSQTAAKQANLQRYQQGLATLQSGYAAAQTQAQQFGTSALQDIEESAVQQRAGGEQDLISRGLGGTTIRGAMTRGVERERLRGRARIGEQRAMLLGQLAQQRARDISGFIERRQDVGPNLGMFANLIQAAQQGSGGGGGGGVIRRTGPMASQGLTMFGQPFGSRFRRSPSATLLQQRARLGG